MNKIYIKRHSDQAGKYIYKGFISAWEHCGYEVKLFDDLLEIKDSGDYEIMCLYSDIGYVDPNVLTIIGKPSDWNDERRYEIIKRSSRAYVWVQTNNFPEPWGNHPNWKCLIDDESITRINNLPNVHLWSFGDITEFHNKWKKVNRVMLAFDSINYRNLAKKGHVYDVCFVGGWADNGFNEKRKIMLKHFAELKKANLKCGVFINKNLTHEQENHVLCNSKVALNIHDAYQRSLGFDSNERTFKALGLTGALVCDKVGQVKSTFPHLELYDNPKQMVDLISYHVNLPKEELEQIKIKNKDLLYREHTYVERVKQLREL